MLLMFVNCRTIHCNLDGTGVPPCNPFKKLKVKGGFSKKKKKGAKEKKKKKSAQMKHNKVRKR
jgi:hypothetical protein